MPEFYVTFARKYFPRFFFFGGGASGIPPSPTPMFTEPLFVVRITAADTIRVVSIIASVTFHNFIITDLPNCRIESAESTPIEFLA